MTERLETVFAAKRFFAAVQATVLSQVVLVFERFVADRTHERTLTYNSKRTNDANNNHNNNTTTIYKALQHGYIVTTRAAYNFRYSYFGNSQ